MLDLVGVRVVICDGEGYRKGGTYKGYSEKVNVNHQLGTGHLVNNKSF
jgi:hypothetical protein